MLHQVEVTAVLTLAGDKELKYALELQEGLPIFTRKSDLILSTETSKLAIFFSIEI